MAGAATESDFKDLLNELEIMNSVGNHPNLINLIGACSKGGELKTYMLWFGFILD